MFGFESYLISESLATPDSNRNSSSTDLTVLLPRPLVLKAIQKTYTVAAANKKSRSVVSLLSYGDT